MSRIRDEVFFVTAVLVSTLLLVGLGGVPVLADDSSHDGTATRTGFAGTADRSLEALEDGERYWRGQRLYVDAGFEDATVDVRTESGATFDTLRVEDGSVEVDTSYYEAGVYTIHEAGATEPSTTFTVVEQSVTVDGPDGPLSPGQSIDLTIESNRSGYDLRFESVDLSSDELESVVPTAEATADGEIVLEGLTDVETVSLGTDDLEDGTYELSVTPVDAETEATVALSVETGGGVGDGSDGGKGDGADGDESDDDGSDESREADDDEDETTESGDVPPVELQDGEQYWLGQRLYAEYSVDAQTVDVRDESGATFDTLRVEDGSVEVNTGFYGTGTFALRDSRSDELFATYTVVDQSLALDVRTESITAGDEVDLTIESNRSGYDLRFGSADLTDDELGALLPSTERTDDGEFVREIVTDAATLTVETDHLDAGRYELYATPVDAEIEATASLSVDTDGDNGSDGNDTGGETGAGANDESAGESGETDDGGDVEGPLPSSESESSDESVPGFGAFGAIVALLAVRAWRHAPDG